MIYPQKINIKKRDRIINIYLISSGLIGIILIYLNKMLTPNVPWAGLVNAGIIYIWIIVLYSIKKSVNIAGHVLMQTVTMSMLTIYIDYKLGYKNWSVSIALPIIIIIANATMFILTLVSRKKYLKYSIYQLIVVLLSMIPILLIKEDMVNNKVLSIVASSISGLNFIISVALCARDLKEIIIRKFHM